MRTIFAVLANIWSLLWALLLTPLRRLFAARADFVLLELTGDIPWRARLRSHFRFGGRQRPVRAPSIEVLGDKLALLARDRRLRGLVVKVEAVELSGARLARIREQLVRLKQAGKEVVFYGRAVDMREYALMAVGSRIHLAPGGRLDLKGYAAELTVFGALLERIGVRAHFFRRGRYKTAPETFTDAEVSVAQKETAEQLVSDQFERVVERIAEGRGRSTEEVRALIDDGPYTSARALRSGLIDAVSDGEELEMLLAPEGKERARLLPLAAYAGPHAFRLPRLHPVVRAPLVAMVPISGIIKTGDTVQGPLAPRAAGSDSVVRALRRAREDRRVKAVVVAIDSRGGSALASELIYRAMKRTAEKKPVVAWIENVAASGGYMAAVGARHIVSAPGAVVGSIGVFGGKFELSGLLATLGVGQAVVRQGRNADLYSPFNGFDEEQRALMDRDIEETYQAFLSIVAEGRGKSVEEVHRLGEGRVYSGRRAHSLGLVDLLGDFEDAVAKAAELAALRKRPEVVTFEDVRRALNPLALKPPAADVERLLSERIFAFADGPMPPPGID